MLGHTKTHHTEKDAIKAKIKADLTAFKKCYVKKIEEDDLSFIRELQEEFENLLYLSDPETVSADEAFKDLINQYGKAGALLKGIRIREELNQTDFAKLIGVTQANLSSMESGARSIGKNKAKIIAEMFDVDYRSFL
ncbi:TPA: helix-turn-helix transcriptional regulator [Legionella pneumophila]|nr:helix-turn-helix transcriptional regulator [Legionella pneumophila]